MPRLSDAIAPPDTFVERHLGPRDTDIAAMCAAIGIASMDALVAEAVPASIRTSRPLGIGAAMTETEAMAKLRRWAEQDAPRRSYLGQGYYDTITPPVILRNILENPGWYTQYTPYQAEISQGRLEALLLFQTLVGDLAGLPISNASMLDEATAAAEAMTLAHNVVPGDRRVFLVDSRCHAPVIDVVRTRAEPLGIEVRVGELHDAEVGPDVFGVLVPYPATGGQVLDWTPLVVRAHAAGAKVAVAADLLALVLLEAPGAWGADICVGSAQRFGVPMGFGGPHAGFLAARDEFKRAVPGRIVGVSIDAAGQPALRLALQTREQHIRREKATSNICTAQVLLAIVAAMYAVYHGPEGLRRIATRTHAMAVALRDYCREHGLSVGSGPIFDTFTIHAGDAAGAILDRADRARIDVRDDGDGTIVVALDEAVNEAELLSLAAVLTGADGGGVIGREWISPIAGARRTEFCTHAHFQRYHSETEMLRFLHRLEAKDTSLTSSMIPLGSCTMKLNATAEMIPVTWPGFGRRHPFGKVEHATGYRALFSELETWLADITGFAATSLQPNAGSQGEYAGLLVIRAYHRARGDHDRDVCLIPSSAHGTNPASASLAAMKVVVVKCDARGNIDLDDLRARATEHAPRLAAMMVTYPSTHGVFEDTIREACAIVHQHGGQVYMDGANLNALVGLVRPGEIGADVCHINLHKTFCIPHGGGGPGMGPICCAPQLAPYLPGHSTVRVGGAHAISAVSGAPWGSASILPIPWAYMAMMGSEGLVRATRVALLSANYLATKLAPHFPVLYTGANGRVAHECIIDLRHLKATSGIEVVDVAKRLMDYGFHAPTISFPVPGTMMIEPTESESLAELDRFVDAMGRIRGEIARVERGEWTREDNPVKCAPHTLAEVTATEWKHAYPRELAAFPSLAVRGHKTWPTVARINDVHGDRNLVCACPPMEAYSA